MSNYHANVSFHGVSKIEIGEVSQHKYTDGRTWQAVTIYIYDDEGRVVDSIAFHTDEGPLAVEFSNKPVLEVA